MYLYLHRWKKQVNAESAYVTAAENNITAKKKQVNADRKK